MEMMSKADQSGGGSLAGRGHLLQGRGIATDQAEPIIITLVFPKVKGISIS